MFYLHNRNKLKNEEMPIMERNKQTNSPKKLNLTKDELSNIKLKFGRVINERMSEVSSGKS